MGSCSPLAWSGGADQLIWFAVRSDGMPNRRGTSVLADSEAGGTVCEGPQKRRGSRKIGDCRNANRSADGNRENELIAARNLGDRQLL